MYFFSNYTSLWFTRVILPTVQCKGASAKINVKYSEYVQKLVNMCENYALILSWALPKGK